VMHQSGDDGKREQRSSPTHGAQIICASLVLTMQAGAGIFPE